MCRLHMAGIQSLFGCLAIEWRRLPTNKKFMPHQIVVWGLKFKIGEIDGKLGEDSFDDDNDNDKYLMAVEHGLCIVYLQQSLRAPL